MNNKKEVLQQIITLLSSLVEDEETPSIPVKEKKTRKKSRAKTSTENPVVRSSRATKNTFKTTSKNKFESMDIRNMHKEDVEIDKLLSSGPPCPRTRGYTTIDVCCRSCGKRESVSPILAGKEPSRYKCNACATSGG